MDTRVDPNRPAKRPVSVALGCILALLVITGCAETEANSGVPDGSSPTADLPFDIDEHADVHAELVGSGSSFQEKYLNAAIDTLDNVLPRIDVTYAGGGSGQGKSDLADGLVAFAGTDSTIDPDATDRFESPVLYFPTVVAPITVSYNLDDVSQLRLDGPTLARILTTDVTRWDDPDIVAVNPGIELPSTPITVCRRSDSSGTTMNFSSFLASAGGDGWTLGVGDSLNWPPGTLGAAGNGGVTQCIQSNSGAIGYVDLADAVAQDLTWARIRNRSGRFVAPTLEGAAAAAGVAQVKDDLTYDPIDGVGPEVYPITSPTWVILQSHQPDAATAQALRTFLEFLLTDGQAPTFTASVNYAPVPEGLAQRALVQLGAITAP